eukprot:gene14493-17593_t
MWLKNITLLNFKNYTDADVRFSRTVNAFIGNNGAGKTNLLDAIHYLCLCKGYFNPVDSQQIKTGEELFLIQGDFERKEKNEKITCGVKKNQKKQFKRNKKDYEKLADHIGLFPVVMISPYDVNIIMEGSEERRRFMDNVISQTDAAYLDELILYNRHLLNRNALLKQIAQTRKYDPALLQIFDEQLVASGMKIFEKRKRFMEEYVPLFNQYYTVIAQGAEEVTLFYQSQLNDTAFEMLLQQSAEKDKVLERTTTGIHKDDLLFGIRETPLKKFGSQGQQKSFLIALKLAQYAYLQKYKGFKPLLLLDDIFDKLDDQRMHKLMEMVSHQDFGQIFITDTGRERPKDITLKEGIEKLLSVYKLRGKFDQTSVVALWPEIMGKAIGNRTTTIYVANKKLFVRIESSVIKNELLMVRTGIIQKINERTGSEVITEIPDNQGKDQYTDNYTRPDACFKNTFYGGTTRKAYGQKRQKDQGNRVSSLHKFCFRR